MELGLEPADCARLAEALRRALDVDEGRGEKAAIARKLTERLGKNVSRSQYRNVVEGSERNPALTVLRWCLASHIEVTINPDEGWTFKPLK